MRFSTLEGSARFSFYLLAQAEQKIYGVWKISCRISRKITYRLVKTPIMQIIIRLFNEMLKKLFLVHQIEKRISTGLPALQDAFYDDWRGSVIENVFENDGVVFGKETVERFKTMQFLSTSLTKRKTYLIQDQLNPLLRDLEKADQLIKPILMEKKNEILNEIDACVKFLKNAEDGMKTGWLGSRGYRDAIKKWGNLQDTAEHHAPAVVNFRVETLTDAEGNELVKFLRGGAITDPRDGSTSLLQLENDYQLMLKKYQTQSLSLFQDEKLFLETQCKNLETKLKDRRRLLRELVLQLVTTQVVVNLEKIQQLSEEKPLLMVHLGVLNQIVDEIDEDWPHIERHAMQDALKIFEEFENKKIIFDGQGPYIDVDNNIHLPVSRRNMHGDHKRIPIMPVYFNLSVQGYNENKGLQEEINKKAFGKLLENSPDEKRELFTKKLQPIITSLFDKKKSTYDLAEDLAFELLKLNAFLYLFCWSGKDRSGYLSARMNYRFLEPRLESLSLPINKIREIKEKFSKQVLETAVKIAKECTGYNFLKIYPNGRGVRNSKIQLLRNYGRIAVSYFIKKKKPP